MVDLTEDLLNCFVWIVVVILYCYNTNMAMENHQSVLIGDSEIQVQMVGFPLSCSFSGV